LDTGNDIKAAEQIGLAEEQLEGITGGEVEDEVEEGEEEAEEVED
jgi:hypothetical protein